RRRSAGGGGSATAGPGRWTSIPPWHPEGPIMPVIDLHQWRPRGVGLACGMANLHRVSPLDAAWLYVDSAQTPMHVGCLQIFAKLRGAPAHFEVELERRLRSCTTLAPPFSLKLAQGWSSAMLPAWTEESH